MEGCRTLVVNIARGRREVRHMASVSGHPLVNIPDLRPVRSKPAPQLASPVPSLPKTSIVSSQERSDAQMAKPDNGLDFVHVAMFIAGAAASYISVVLSLAITALMLMVLSKKQIELRATDDDKQPSPSPSPSRSPRRKSANKPVLEYQRRDDSYTPPTYRRHSQPRRPERSTVIPVSSRRKSIDSKRTVDEEYAFRPYN